MQLLELLKACASSAFSTPVAPQRVVGIAGALVGVPFLVGWGSSGAGAFKRQGITGLGYGFKIFSQV